MLVCVGVDRVVSSCLIGKIGAARSGFGYHGVFDLRVGSYGFTQLCAGVDRVASSCVIGRIGAARSGFPVFPGDWSGLALVPWSGPACSSRIFVHGALLAV